MRTVYVPPVVTAPSAAPATPAIPPAPAALPDGTNPRLVVSDDAVADARAQLAGMEANFEACLAGLRMHFQPIVHARDHSIFAYEA